MTADPNMGTSNLRVYERPRIVRWYASWTSLLPAEEVIFATYSDAWVGREVLDIGIGGGRTTIFLAPRAGRYVGVDYSPGMVAAALERHPGQDLRVADARDLSAFSDASFDFVIFSYNGLDTIGHADRELVLREAHRVLRPGGLFLFSSHNLHHRPGRWFLRDMFHVEVARSPLGLAKSLGRVGVRIKNFLTHLPTRRSGPGYAIVLDPANDFGTPQCYVEPAEAKRQVAAAGLELVAAFNVDGQVSKCPIEADSFMLHYLTRKPAD